MCSTNHVAEICEGAVQKDAKAEKKNNNNKNNGETLYIGWWIIKTRRGVGLISSHPNETAERPI